MRFNQVNCVWWVIPCQYTVLPCQYTENSVGSKSYGSTRAIIKSEARQFPVASYEYFNWGKSGGFSEGFSDTAISIRVKIAAHFTELSAALMLHHGLLFQYVSEAVWWNVWHLTDSDGIDEGGGERKGRRMELLPWSLCTNKLVEKWWGGSYEVKKFRS